MKSIAIRSIAILFAVTMLWALSTDVLAEAAGLPLDITASCRFAPTSHDSTFRRAVDGLMTTAWSSDGVGTQAITIRVSKGQSVSGLYLRWDSVQPKWNLYAVDDQGTRTLCSSGGNDEQWMTEWAAVPAALANSQQFVLESAQNGQALQIIELSVFTGGVPDYAPRWQRYDGKPIDTMVVACHPDDEDLYLGPMLPTSVLEGHNRNLVVTMTYVSKRRRIEASESDWMLGETFYPDMRRAIDVKTQTLREAELYWPVNQTEAFLVEQIRKYRPSVIATQDANGEYGHGAHRETEYVATLAFRDAADPGKFPDSAARYGTWKAAKLYVHLYAGNPIVLNAGRTVDAYGGRKIAQIVAAAYARHKSQLPGRSLPFVGNRYDMERFGLFGTRVGPDIHRDRLYDNVTPQAMAQLNPDNDASRTLEQPSAQPASTSSVPQRNLQLQPQPGKRSAIAAVASWPIAGSAALVAFALLALGVGVVLLARRGGWRRYR